MQGSNFTNIAVYSLGVPIPLNLPSITDNILNIAPLNPFVYNSDYTVVIPAGAVIDTAGNPLSPEYTFGFHTEPANVNNQTTGYCQIIAGGSSSGYALKPDGTVWAWGANDTAQLGNNSYANSSVPIQVLWTTSDIVSTSPGAGSTGVNTGAGIDITFQNSIFTINNIEGISITAQGGTTGAVTYQDYTTNAEYSFSFTTQFASDTTPPTWPSSATISVKAYDLTPDSFSATLKWPAADDPSGVVAYNVYQLTGNWDYGEFIETTPRILIASEPGSTLSCNFTGPSNVYNFKVEAMDANGNWSSNGPIEYYMAPTLETVPPTLNFTSPSDGSAGILVDSDIMVAFSESVKPGPNYAGISLKAGTSVVEVTYGFNEDGSMYISPAQNLDYNTTYTVYLPTGSVQDLSGTPLAETTFKFTTVVSPEIISTFPVNSSIVSPINDITISFVYNILPAVSFEGISIKANAGTVNETVVNYTYNYYYRDLYLQPSSLQANTTYTVTIPEGAVTYPDYNNSANTAYSFSFTTQSAAPSSSGPRMAYIPNFTGNSVSVVDIGTQNVVKTIYGLNQPWAVALNPKGNMVFVTNIGNNSISVINPNRLPNNCRSQPLGNCSQP